MASERATRLDDARLYLCTDSRRRQGDLEQFLDAVLAAGVDVVQLREKGLDAREEIELAEVFVAAARRHGTMFSVNDRADVAWVVRPDILHLGQDDLPVPAARAIVGDGVLIGRSTHAPHEVDMAAASKDVDYFCVGPVWPTPTKPGRAAPGLSLLGHAASRAAGKPWFAIGGVDLANLDEVLDPGAAAAELARRLRG
jgi:thiamine-phosphate pyrophosphorylase